jgi:hypothetical protein
MEPQAAMMIAFGLTIGATLFGLVFALTNPEPVHWWLYPRLLVPVVFAYLPLRWRKFTPLSTALLVLYILVPLVIVN